MQHFSYPNGFSGDPIMMQALACFINIQFQPYRPVDMSQIATAPGAASCLDALLYTICDAGDGVLVPTPYWSEGYRSLTLIQYLLTGLTNYRRIRLSIPGESFSHSGAGQLSQLWHCTLI